MKQPVGAVMHLRTGVTLTTILTLSLIPLAVADGGAWFAADGTIGTSAVTASRFDVFSVELAQGQELAADLSWPASQGSLVLVASHASGTVCEIPGASPECLVDTALPLAEAIADACEQNAWGGNAISGGPQHAAMVAATEGTYQVTVMGGIVSDHVDYHLHIQVDGAAPTTVGELRGLFTPTGALGQHCVLV